MIGQEAIEELAERIAIEKCSTNHAEFFDVENAAVNQRFFDDRQAQSAGVNEAVAERYREHDAQSVFAKKRINVRRRRTGLRHCHFVPLHPTSEQLARSQSDRPI